MKRMIVVFSVILCAACTSSSVPAMTPEAVQSVDAAIRANAEAFDSAARARDLDRLMSLYAENAILMPPNAPPQNGRAAIRQFWGQLLGAPSVDLDLIVEEVQACGDIAVDRGRYEVTTPFRDSGKYIVIWRNRGGKWEIVNDIFNSNLAPAR